MREVSSSYWIDVKAKLHGDSTDSLEGILKDAASKSPVPLVTLIVYDLPNRDCRAKASNGEICCVYNADRTCDYNTDNQACTAGLKEYETEYVDIYASIVAKYNGVVPMALIIEPDSLPNMASNMKDPHCFNSATAYKEGIKYAINTISTASPKASLYLDAAHGGWLGWSDNMNAFTKLVQDMDISSKIRGFATNVANYQPLGTMCPWTPTAEPDRNDYCLGGAHGSE